MGLRSFVMGAATGMALVYFLDPEDGERRRNGALERLGPMLGRAGEGSAKVAQYGKEQVPGLATGMIPPEPDNPNLNDNTLRDRIESVIFKSKTFSRENINIDVADGVVELRGELPDQKDIDKLIQRVKKVADVGQVVSYLHLPGTPAPNKESALRIS